MRWGLRRGGEEKGKPAEWIGRLGAIGARLDATGMPFSGLAISLTGAEVWINGLGMYAGRHHHGWKPVELRFETPAATDGPGAGDWSARLQSIGHMLDRDPRLVRDPCVVQLDNEYLVTATVAETIDGVERWATATWRTVAAR